MIKNAKDTPLAQQTAGLPNVSAAMTGWFQPMEFIQICKQKIDGYVQEISTKVKTRGVRQPFTARQLEIKPEGQRSWRWETMHCLPDVILKPDDKIYFDGIDYRVMQQYDWKEYGYVQYDIVQGYSNC